MSFGLPVIKNLRNFSHKLTSYFHCKILCESQYERKEKKFHMVRFKKLCKKEDMKDLEQISWHGILSNKITNYFLNKELTQYGIQIIYRPIFNRIWETTPTPKLK